MMERLRLRLGGLLRRLRRSSGKGRSRPMPQGRARSVIVLKPRDSRFREVICVLRDDAFSDPDCDREELLRQAREVARAETGSVLPPRERLPLWPAVLLLLGTALILKLTGVI